MGPRRSDARAHGRRRTAALLTLAVVGLMAQAEPEQAPAPAPSVPRAIDLPRPSLGDMDGEWRAAPVPPEPSALVAPERNAPVGLYVTPDGLQRFILDRRGREAKLRFEGEDEVYVLSDEPAQRGDRILRLDTGEVLLRITNWGGVTLYAPGDKAGVPAARMGDADTIQVTDRPLAVLQDLAAATASDLSARLDAKISIEVDWPALAADPATRATLHDAIYNTRAGLLAALEARDVRRALSARLRVLRFVTGAAAAAGYDGDAFTVVFAPDKGLQGRLSSQAIAAVASGG